MSQTAIEMQCPPPRIGELRAVAAMTFCLFLAMVVALIRPFFSKLSWMTLAQDDFFYYLVVARNIAQGHGSTFNGIAPTNGYQPLYLWLWTLLSYVAVKPAVIVACLALLNLAASALTFFLVQRLIRRTGVSPLLVFALSAYAAVTCFSLYCHGMEVTLTVPIVLAVLSMLQDTVWLARSWWNACLLGLALSAMVLSRIDTLILGGMFLAGILASRVLRKSISRGIILGLLLGLIPLLLYFLSNRILFDTWLPISGMAKELKVSLRPSLLPLQMLIRYHSLMLIRFFVLAAAAIALFPFAAARLSAMERVTYLSLLLFPFVYYTVLCFISDWGTWPWYWYPLRLAFLASCIVFCRIAALAGFLQRPWVAAIIAIAAIGELCGYGWVRDGDDVDDSVSIAQYVNSHPGVYAMGDRSGRVGYLIHSPMVHLEGLVMDRPFLNYIKDEAPLRKVLSAYHVRYYIATSNRPYTGCFEAVEPAQAGDLSAHMHGEFCETPVFRYMRLGRETLIFDLDQSSQASR
jgi:uncharacterized membrane protein YeaQ/YmgE (transglycosylase-associated protein family)